MSSRFDLRIDGTVTEAQIKTIYDHLNGSQFYEVEDLVPEKEAVLGVEMEFSVQGYTRESEPDILSDLDRMNVNFVMTIYADNDDYDTLGLGSLFFKRIGDSKVNCVTINNDGTQMFTVREIDDIFRVLINIGLRRKDPFAILRNSERKYLVGMYPKCYNNASKWLAKFEEILFSKIIYEHMSFSDLKITEDGE